MPVLTSWLPDPLWDQPAALLKVLRFGCSYEAIADSTCSATTIRGRRDEWIRLGLFARLKQTALDA